MKRWFHIALVAAQAISIARPIATCAQETELTAWQIKHIHALVETTMAKDRAPGATFIRKQ